MPTLLLIDDEPDILLPFVQKAVQGSNVEIVVARTGAEGALAFRVRSPDVVLLDVNLPDATGLDVFHQLRQIDARCPVVFVTASSTTETAIEAMKRGAYDYLFKPVDLTQLQKIVGQALELSRLMKEPALASETGTVDDRADVLIGRCPPMLEVYKAIGRVANQDAIVLVTGESGTGKELVARAIYQHSKRAQAPFLAINCAAIPEPLLESELFGHEKGAFTGADRRRIGKFEQCHGGTLFLDEIGDMTLATQAKLLRVLQDQRFERVGGNETIATNVRLVAATNRDLRAMAAEGRFRPDLYYRLSVFSIHIPALRERGEDIPLLVNHYLRRFNREMGKDVREVTPAVMEMFRTYPWPGNIRELQSVIKQALLVASGAVLVPTFLPEALRRRDGGSVPPPASASASSEFLPGLEQFARQRLAEGSTDLYAECLQRMERLLLPLVLDHCQGSQVKASQSLGINRRTLRNKLRDLGLTLSRSVEIKEGDEDEQE